MFSNIGAEIRSLRTKKGIGLNEFAGSIGVSPGYLSNLETGKTTSIDLNILDKLQAELNLFSFITHNDYEITSIQLKSLIHQLITIENEYPQSAKSLRSLIEHAIELISETN
ncbi:helix-turn-helix domain-containing protein [Cytobacillus firmus]